MELRQAMIFVKDMARMTAFYRDGLGLPVLPGTQSAGWVEFAAGGCTLALHEIPPAIARGIVIADPPTPRENTPIKLVFQTNDLEAARAQLTAHGAVMLEPRRPGSCDGLDPEGNVFSLVTRRA